MSEIRLKRIDHVGIVVDDLADARRQLEKLLGLPAVPGVSNVHVSTLYFPCGDVSIEAIEIHDEDARGLRLGTEKARIEHIAIEVDDVQATLQALEGLGIRATSQPRESGRTLTFWTVPETSDGMMLQFLQKNPGT